MPHELIAQVLALRGGWAKLTVGLAILAMPYLLYSIDHTFINLGQ